MSDLMQAINTLIGIFENYSKSLCHGQNLKPAEMEQLIQVELSEAIKVSMKWGEFDDSTFSIYRGLRIQLGPPC